MPGTLPPPEKAGAAESEVPGRGAADIPAGNAVAETDISHDDQPAGVPSDGSIDDMLGMHNALHFHRWSWRRR